MVKIYDENESGIRSVSVNGNDVGYVSIGFEDDYYFTASIALSAEVLIAIGNAMKYITD